MGSIKRRHEEKAIEFQFEGSGKVTVRFRNPNLYVSIPPVVGPKNKGRENGNVGGYCLRRHCSYLSLSSVSTFLGLTH